MMKNLLTKTLLVAAGLLMGSGVAWAYDTPDGYGVSKVFIGTAGIADDNGIVTTVTEEDFGSGTYDNTVFKVGTCYHATESEKLKLITNYVYVAPPEIESSVGESPYPTYVGANGKVLQWQSRSNATQYGEINMDPVSSGKLVFGVDLNFGGHNENYAPQVIFVDPEGNRVLQLGFNCNSGETEYFQYVVGVNGTATNDGTVGTSKLRSKYTGHAIKDIVIDMESGAVVYTLDCIGTDGKRYSKTSTKGINIGTGKTIAGIRISRNFAESQQSNYIWIDNVELYKLDTYANLYATYKADNYGTKVAALDAAGQAYWTTNTAPNITTAAEYKEAIDALPTTYVAAVKAQTTGGSDMTDAIPNAACTSAGSWTGTIADTPALNTWSTETNTGIVTNFMQYWVYRGNTLSANTMSQTITGLPNGYYKISATVRLWDDNTSSTETTISGASIFGNTAETAISGDRTAYAYDDHTATYYTSTPEVEAQVSDGTLQLGIKTVADQISWVSFKDFHLTYLGTDKYDYTINAVAGGSTIKTLASSSSKLWPGETYGVYIPKVVYNETDSKYYVLDDADNANLDGYYASYTMGTADATQEINYTVDESIVVFNDGIGSYRNVLASQNRNYSSGDYVDNGIPTNYANARNRGFGLGSLSSGIYRMEAYVVNSTKGRAIALRNNDQPQDPIVQITNSNKITGLLISSNFELTTATSLVVSGANANNNDGSASTTKSALMEQFDYIIIRKLNVNDEPVIIGDINYATASLGDMTEKVTLKPGESYHYRFVNHNSGSSSQWLNYTVPVYNSNGDNVILVRADNWEEKQGNNTGCTSDFVWGTNNATFISEMDGATVDMTVSYSTANVFSMSANITTKNNLNWTYSYTSDYADSGISLSGNIQVALSVYNSWLEVLSEGQASVAVTVPNGKQYATFNSDYALDFTDVTDILAYTAAISGTTVTLTKVTGAVPAHTGLLLRNKQMDGAAVSVPVAASAVAPATNDFVAVTEAQTLTSGYVLATVEGVQGFYPVNSNGTNIAAGKAYLPAGSGARLSMQFDDEETTGISTVAPSDADGDGACYNLKGQRVAAPAKGLFIKNGKKVIIK